MKKRRFLAGFAATAIAASMMTVTAGATEATEPTPSFTYTNDTTTNRSFSFNKYLVVDKNTTVPNVEFNFSIAPAGIQTAHLTDTKVELYNGLTGVTFTDSKGTFTTASTTTPGGTAASFTGNTGTATTIKITDDTSKKYATDAVTLDFSNVVFTEPGVYRYTVSETVPTTGGAYTALTATQRTLDVYVQDDEGDSDKLKVMGYVLYDKVITGAPTNVTTADPGVGYNTSEVAESDATGKKSSGFVNSYETHNLTFGKEVTGNQGSKDKYFKYTVTISNATVGDKYLVNVNGNVDNTLPGNADASVIANPATTVSGNNVNEITVGTNGSVATDFYLHDGQYITICGLGKGVSYEVAEANEDYTKTEKIVQNISTLNWDGTEGYDALNDAVAGTIASADIHTGYTNTKEGTIPTGIILSVAAPAVVGLGVAGLIVTLNVKRRREEAED